MFIFGFIVGGLVFGTAGLLIGASNSNKVKAAANAEIEAIKAKLTK